MRSTNAAKLFEALADILDVEAPTTVAVGYSGGRDSAVLLWSLVQVWGAQRVEAIHVDHGWRSEEERQAEAEVVSQWCQRLGVPLVSFGPPSSLVLTEASARAHRYRCFDTFLSTRPGGLVFLGHHADDQAETILMRLLKGRSWQGLGGMPRLRGPYRRPFLGLRRQVLASVAEELAIPVFEDSTNGTSSPTRNFLRREVIPGLQQRFPRVTEALVDFGEVWSQVASLPGAHPGWTPHETGYAIEGAVWDRWSTLERQGQLLALANQVDPNWVPSRRFLETVARDGRRGRCRGAGWAWSRRGSRVTWGRVVPSFPEYVVRPQRGVVYNLGSYRFSWDLSTGLALPGLDPHRPWVWRSALPGMVFASRDNPHWGRDLRRHRLGALDPGRLVLVLQEGLLKAVVDPQGNRVVWSESGGEKLHNPGIFVNLIAVTPNSTE